MIFNLNKLDIIYILFLFQNEVRTIFEKYGKIRRLKPTSNGKQAQLTYGNLSEAVAAVQGVHDKPPLKLQVDYYRKNNDFVSRYEYTHCQISSVDPIERSYRVRRVKDASNYRKFHEMLQEVSNKCSETVDVDKLVIDNIYSVMYGGVWKRGKILSTNPIEIDLFDDGKTLKSPVKITSYKKLGKLADNSPFSRYVMVKASPDNEKKSLHTGSYVEIRMIGQHENIIHVVRKSDEVLNNNINNKKSSPCPAAIKIDKTSIQKNDAKIAKVVDTKIPCDEKNIEQVKKNNIENTNGEKKINIKIKKEHENNIDLVAIDDNNDDMIVQEDDSEIDNIDVIDVESSYNFKNESSEPIKNNSGVQINQWTPWLNDGKSDAVKAAEKIPTARIVPLNVPSVESDIPIVVQTINPNIVEKENIEKKSSSIGTENPAPRNNKNITIKDFNLKNNSRVVVQSYVGPSVIYVTSMELDDINQKKYLNKKICCTAETSDLINNPNVGDYVLACYNGSYYRARVLSIRDNKIAVNLIDYGFIAEIEPGDMKKIPESLMNHPLLMKQVTFKNVDNQTPTNEAANYIKTLIATEEILICSFDDNQQDKVELKTLDNKSVNDEINKLLKKCDNIDVIPIIPKPKPQLRLNIIKREEIMGIAARKNDDKIDSSKPIKGTTKSELIETKSIEELSLKRKLTTETSSNIISSIETTKKIIKSTESSNKPESIYNKHRSQRKSSKEKSPESKISSSSSTTTSSSRKIIISPIKSYKLYPRCKIYCSYCNKYSHERQDCRVLKRKRNRYHSQRLENSHDSSGYYSFRYDNDDLRNHESIQRSSFNNPRYDRVRNYFDE